EVLVGPELVQLALEQQGVGAEIDEAATLDEAPGDGADPGVEQRFAACDADDGRAALVGSAQAVLHREIPLQDRDGVLDLSAAGAGEIAAEEGFQHEHERILLAPRKPLLEDVLRHRRHLRCRDRHSLLRALSDDLRAGTCSGMPRGIAGFGDFSRRSYLPGCGVATTLMPAADPAIRAGPRQSQTGSPARLQIEDVPR